jgi:hypothetical protein
VPVLVEIAGGSMEPSLGRGWRVVVEPTADPLCPGDIVLIRGAQGNLVHRVVHVADFHAGTRVFHRGDAGGGTGLSLVDDVLGRVTAIVAPPDQPLPTVERLSATLARRLRGARVRCRLYALTRQLAEGLAVGNLVPLDRAAPLVRRLLR